MPSTKTEKPTVSVTITHVQYATQAIEALQPESVLARFVDPIATVAVGKTVPAGEASLATPADLAILVIPAEAPQRDEWLGRVRAWIRTQGGPPAVKIALDEGSWLLFRARQAVIFAPAEDIPGLLTAVIDFAHYEHQLRVLESELAADWNTAQRHLSLIHTVSSAEIRKTADVGAATQQAMLRRMRYARIEPHLLLAPDTLVPSAREVARRLRSRNSITTRLETADAQVEVYEDIYDMANQRRGEYVNFLREYKIEIYILVVLVLELFMIGADFYMTHIREDPPTPPAQSMPAMPRSTGLQ